MVDSIKGSGGNVVIITTKPKPKAKTDNVKDGQFDKALQGKVGEKSSGTASLMNAPTRSETNMAILAQQQANRMKKVETIAKQVKDGTYKMVDSQTLANHLFAIFTDPKTRDKFIKKVLSEEVAGRKDRGKNISDLELKKLVKLFKDNSSEEFEDAELEAVLKEFA